MFRFETPSILFLLLLPLLLCYLRHRRRLLRAAVDFSSVAHARNAGPSLRQCLAWLPEFLRVVAMLCLVVALARPQSGREQIHDISNGIAIEMVLDRSGSMAQELEYNGTATNRLNVAKDIFSRFVFGDGKQLGGRPNDLIGLITFARYADTVCPLTLGHDALRSFIDPIDIVAIREEDGTAIGDALALAAARLHTAEETLAKQKNGDADTKADADYTIKSKIIILLTDGENNIGSKIADAAALAEKWNIKVYAIGVSGNEGFRTIQTFFGTQKIHLGGNEMDTRELEDLAKRTGGLFRKADNAKSLLAIYEEIDQLERSDVESIRFVNYRELFLPFALTALALIIAEQLLNRTVFRRLP